MTTISFNSNDVDLKREAMKEELLQYFYCFSDQTDYNEHVAEHNIEQGQRKQRGVAHEALLDKLEALPPFLVDATVGLGKSNGITAVTTAALNRGLKVCIVVPTHKLASEYCSRIPNAYHYFGRQSESQAMGDAHLQKFTCFQKDDVNRASSKNHLPAQSICRVCPHAYAHVIENVADDLDRVEKAREFFKIRNLKAENYKPCRFLYDGLPEALSSEVVVITPESFSDAMGFFQVKDGSKFINEMQRLVIVDERISLTKEIDICAGGISGWLNSLDTLTKHLTETKRNPELLSILPSVEATFRELTAAIVLGTQINKDAIIAVRDQVRDIGGLKGNTASWERVDYSEKNEFFIPLRALYTLALNLEKGTVRKSKNKTHIYEVSQLLEWAITHGSTIFLDATTPIAMKKVIEAVNGKYFDAHVEQNMHITRFSGHLYSRGNTRRKSYQEQSKNRIKELELIASQMKRPAAIITHKSWLKNSVEHHMTVEAASDAAESFFKRTGVRLGWFGAHDRGHNEWDGFNIAIVGMPLLSADAILAAYSGDRTALMAVGVNWPAWDGALSEPVWSDCIPPLPTQPEVRDWLLDMYAATIAQGIGRARAVNSASQIQIQIYGGLQTAEMNAALAVHGVIVDVTTTDTVHRTQAVYRARGTDIDVIDHAILMLRLDGEKVSRRSVRAEMVRVGQSGNENVINARLKELREANDLPPAPKAGRPGKLVCDTNKDIYDIAYQLP